MKVYKFLEIEPKIYGLRIRDWMFIIAFGGSLIMIVQVMEFFGLKYGVYSVLVEAALIGLAIFLLRRANKKKCPNFLDAYLSYKLFQPKYINPKFDMIKKGESKANSTNTLNY